MSSLMHSCQMTDCTEDFNKKMQINVLKTDNLCFFLPADDGERSEVRCIHGNMSMVTDASTDPGSVSVLRLHQPEQAAHQLSSI